jgi:prepilin-type N-terminal cleavage/methylation domain-containing protein
MNKTSSHARGFTLIELLVVISIIGLLSSIIMASTQTAKAAARDSVRTQEVRQIDMAIQSYALSNDGKAPDLSAGPNSINCSPNVVLTYTTVTNCVALSTAPTNSAQKQAWDNLMSQLQPYMSAPIPPDPCGGSCTSKFNLPIGYTYVAPAAVVYSCPQSNPCTYLTGDSSGWYQVYSPPENATSFVVDSSPPFVVVVNSPLIPNSGNGGQVPINGHAYVPPPAP